MPKYKINREEILQRALTVFRKKGYYHTKISDLAKACGIEKPHFYYYFKDKCDLMKAVLQYTYNIVKEVVLDKAYNEKYSPKIRLRSMMQRTIEIHTGHLDGCFMGNTALSTLNNEPEFEPILRNYFQDWIKALRHLFKTRYSESKANALAVSCLQELQGSIMLMRLYNRPTYLEKTAKKIEELLE